MAVGPTLAVLGFGSMGRKHAANAGALGLSVVAYDPNSGSVSDDAIDDVIVARSAEDALASADLAVVATPASTHTDYLAMAVEAGVHVFVEKPFSDSIQGLEPLLEKADAQGLTVGVAQNLRHHPAVETAALLLKDGAVGKVLGAVSIGASYLPDWRPGQDYRKNYAADPKAGGVIFDWVHEIDMLVHLLGPARVAGAAAASGRHLDMESDESAGIVLNHADGILSTLYLSYASRPALRQTLVFGPDGRLEIDVPARRLRLFDCAGSVIRDTQFGGAHGDDYKSELADFVEAVKEDRAPRCSGREALGILKTVTEIRAAAGLPSRDATQR